MTMQNNPYWIAHPQLLTRNNVTLAPLEEMHFDELTELAADKHIWQHYIFDASNEKNFRKSLNDALTARDKETQYPWVIVHKSTGKIIGSTRLMDIVPEHRKLEIGWTWLLPEFWGTGINEECKMLILSYCFEVLHAVRVLLKTDENNMRSRKAIEKIGGKFEGILRNDMIRENGTHRNSAYYSIIDAEWKETKSRIEKLLC